MLEEKPTKDIALYEKHSNGDFLVCTRYECIVEEEKEKYVEILKDHIIEDNLEVFSTEKIKYILERYYLPDFFEYRTSMDYPVYRYMRDKGEFKAGCYYINVKHVTSEVTDPPKKRKKLIAKKENEDGDYKSKLRKRKPVNYVYDE